MYQSEGGPDVGPSVMMRFKICSEGKLGPWVTMIIGAQTLDHPEKGGLGFQVRAKSYYLSKLGVHIDRAEDKSMHIDQAEWRHPKVFATRCGYQAIWRPEESTPEGKMPLCVHNQGGLSS